MENTIDINNEQFKKIAKEIHSKLRKEDKKDISLMKIQEIVSNSLGFRNQHSLQSHFSKNKADKIKTKNNTYNKDIFSFHSFNEDSFLKFIYFLINEKSGGSIISEKAKSLIKIVNKMIFDIQSMHVQISLNDFKNIIKLNELVNIIYRKNKDCYLKAHRAIKYSIREELEQYLFSLNIVNGNDIDDSIFLEHQKIEDYFDSIFDLLIMISKNNLKVFSLKWATFRYTNKEYHPNETNDSNDILVNYSQDYIEQLKDNLISFSAIKEINKERTEIDPVSYIWKEFKTREKGQIYAPNINSDKDFYLKSIEINPSILAFLNKDKKKWLSFHIFDEEIKNLYSDSRDIYFSEVINDIFSRNEKFVKFHEYITSILLNYDNQIKISNTFDTISSM